MLKRYRSAVIPFVDRNSTQTASANPCKNILIQIRSPVCGPDVTFPPFLSFVLWDSVYPDVSSCFVSVAEKWLSGDSATAYSLVLPR